ncbi:hypothetical protein ACFE04_004525 [Oxalis oulophora]
MDPHSAQSHYTIAEGDQEEQHNEKKSVLKKVKAKAKKIKETLTKHGHEQEHDHERERDMDEEDDDVDDGVQSPEVIHGAPIYDSGKIKQQESGYMPPGLHYDRPTPMSVDPPGIKERHTGVTGIGEGPRAPQNTPVVDSGSHDNRPQTDPAKSLIYDQEGGQPRVNFGRQVDLEEDPHGPNANAPSNYQTKVTNPTGAGGREAGITPLIQRFDKMNMSSEADTKEPETETEHNLSRTEPDKSVSTKVRDELLGISAGSHDQFSPELTPSSLNTNTDSPQTLDTPKDQSETHGTANQNSYTEKISFATSALAEKAAAAKNIVASKLGYGEKEKGISTAEGETNTAMSAEPVESPPSNAKSAAPVEYGKKIASTVTGALTPVYQTVAGAGSTVVSKVRGTGTTVPSETNQEVSGIEGQDKGVSMQGYLAEKLKPGEDDRALSGVISDALHKRKEDVGLGTVEKPVGKVTESEEVTKELGPDEAQSSPQKGVVDMLKGTIGSLFTKEKSQPLPGSTISDEAGFNTGTEEVEHGNELQGERRLQESAN